MAIHSLIDNVNETIRVFSRCKNALISKGVSPSLKATDIPSEIESIQGEISYGTFELSTSNVNEFIDIDTGFDNISDFIAYTHFDATATGKNRATAAIFWDSATSGREWGCRGFIDTSNNNSGAGMVQPIDTRVTYMVHIVSVEGGIVRLQMPANATRTQGVYKWFAKKQS